MEQKAKISDDRICDSICTDDTKLNLMLLEVGRRVERERIRQGYTVPELSIISGVAISVLYRIEKGTSPIGMRSLLRLMWALNKSPEKLIPYEEQVHKKTFGEIVEDMTQCLSPKQKNYLIKLIWSEIGFLSVDKENNTNVLSCVDYYNPEKDMLIEPSENERKEAYN